MWRPRLFFAGYCRLHRDDCGFSAIALITLAQMNALSFTLPLLCDTGFCGFTGDNIRLRRILGLVAGFVEILITLQLKLQPISQGDSLAVLGSIKLASILGEQMT